MRSGRTSAQDVLAGTSRLHERPYGLPRIWGGSEAESQKAIRCWGPSKAQTYQAKWVPIKAGKGWEGHEELRIHIVYWRGDRGWQWGWHGQVEYYCESFLIYPGWYSVLNVRGCCAQWWAHRIPPPMPMSPLNIHIYSYVEVRYCTSIVLSLKYSHLFICWSSVQHVVGDVT